MKKNNIEISLTDFIDFVNKSGTAKLTKVKQIKNRGVYQPFTDFYKTLREGIISIHERGANKKELDKLLINLRDENKLKNYPSSIEGYKKFWGNKKITWFNPPHKHWKTGEIDININPELGLEFNDKFIVVKLYMKAEKLTKDRIAQILSLLEHQLRSEVEKELVFCVLDVKNSKLFTNEANDISLLPLLEGEARSFETIWNSIN